MPAIAKTMNSINDTEADFLPLPERIVNRHTLLNTILTSSHRNEFAETILFPLLSLAHAPRLPQKVRNGPRKLSLGMIDEIDTGHKEYKPPWKCVTINMEMRHNKHFLEGFFCQTTSLAADSYTR